MADQSNDVPQSTSNDEVFNNDFKVSHLLKVPRIFFGNEAITFSSLNEQPAIASVRDDHVDGGSFPEQSSEAVRNLNEPVNEETVTTTSSGVDEDSTKTVTDTSSESSLDYSEQHAEETSLVIFSEPIAESIMTIETHPTANLRLTYESDDHRRYFRDPLVIDVY
ncbi:unnamed protein product [Adineta steineri]|uniref:Uncharacterized protein n=3 Tax=Adineta steineri TaxID=433720 RepID=A0A815F6A2_9BILA|nr:unnamed protein product [Adineta steineri]